MKKNNNSSLKNVRNKVFASALLIAVGFCLGIGAMKIAHSFRMKKELMTCISLARNAEDDEEKRRFYFIFLLLKGEVLSWNQDNTFRESVKEAALFLNLEVYYINLKDSKAPMKKIKEEP
jgi:hypothetical protein